MPDVEKGFANNSDDWRISGPSVCPGKLAENGRSRSFVPVLLIQWHPNRTVISFTTAQAFFRANVYSVNRVDLPA